MLEIIGMISQVRGGVGWVFCCWFGRGCFLFGGEERERERDKPHSRRDSRFFFFPLPFQREKEVDRLKNEAVGLRKELSVAKSEIEARGEALRQVIQLES